MKPTIYRIVALAILSSSLISASGGEFDLRIRTIGGMEPIGTLSIKGASSRKPLSTSYGLSPGFEVYYILNDLFELGVGFQWQLSRKVLSENNPGSFGSIPIYSTTRIKLAAVENFSTYALLKLGYNIFNSDNAFRRIWNSEPGGSFDSTKGGLYGMAALGVSTSVKEAPRWNLDFSMDVGYIFQRFIGSNSKKSYPLVYHEMSVHISLDWLL